MNYRSFSHLINLKNSHFLAFLSAAAMHCGMLVWAGYSSSPTVINQQTIQVSFVAPSSQKQQNENNSHKKFIPDSEQKNALKQNQKNLQQAEKKSEKNLTEKQTSGRVEENATALKSAESDPIFNAAYLNNPAPIYPENAKRRGIQGKTLLDVVVKIDGTAASVTISRSSGNSLLDQAAIDAVSDWKFIPAKRAGKPVQANVIVPIEFKIV